MRKIVLGLAVTLDGYIEGPNGEYDWCMTDQDYGMTPFMDRIDAVFYGRKSFEMAGGNLYPDKQAYVFSNAVSYKPDGAELIQGDVEKKVLELKNKPGKDIWLFGGASLLTTFVKADLVDEYWLSVHPMLLGEGKLLFQNIHQRKMLKHIETNTYDSGLVSLRYERQNL
jgi:dihydrofolate reductase